MKSWLKLLLTVYRRADENLTIPKNLTGIFFVCYNSAKKLSGDEFDYDAFTCAPEKKIVYRTVICDGIFCGTVTLRRVENFISRTRKYF